MPHGLRQRPRGNVATTPFWFRNSSTHALVTVQFAECRSCCRSEGASYLGPVLPGGEGELLCS